MGLFFDTGSVSFQAPAGFLLEQPLVFRGGGLQLKVDERPLAGGRNHLDVLREEHAEEDWMRRGVAPQAHHERQESLKRLAEWPAEGRRARTQLNGAAVSSVFVEALVSPDRRLRLTLRQESADWDALEALLDRLALLARTLPAAPPEPPAGWRWRQAGRIGLAAPAELEPPGIVYLALERPQLRLSVSAGMEDDGDWSDLLERPAAELEFAQPDATAADRAERWLVRHEKEQWEACRMQLPLAGQPGCTVRGVASTAESPWLFAAMREVAASVRSADGR